jgi:hypothetical protein
MEKADFNGKMEVIMKETLWMDSFKVSAFIILQILTRLTKVNSE